MLSFVMTAVLLSGCAGTSSDEQSTAAAEASSELTTISPATRMQRTGAAVDVTSAAAPVSASAAADVAEAPAADTQPRTEQAAESPDAAQTQAQTQAQTAAAQTQTTAAAPQGQTSSIKGVWVPADGSTKAPDGYPDRIEFKDDGVMVIEGYDGTYTVENDKLTINALDRYDYFGWSVKSGILTLTHTGLDTASVEYKKA